MSSSQRHSGGYGSYSSGTTTVSRAYSHEPTIGSVRSGAASSSRPRPPELEPVIPRIPSRSSGLSPRGANRFGSDQRTSTRPSSIQSNSSSSSGYSSGRSTSMTRDRSSASGYSSTPSGRPAGSRLTQASTTGYLSRSRSGTTPSKSQPVLAASSAYTPSTSEAPKRSGSLERRPVGSVKLGSAYGHARVNSSSGSSSSSSSGSSSGLSSPLSGDHELYGRSTRAASIRSFDRHAAAAMESLSFSSKQTARGAADSEASDRILSRGCSLDWTAELPAWSGSKGLANLGNTCFMNSILQCLIATPELVRFMLHPEMLPSNPGPVASAFSSLMRSIWSGSGSSVSPRQFLDQVTRRDRRWGGGRQQDSLEFLQFLLGALQTDTNRVKGKPKYEELKGKGSEEEQALEAFNYARKWNDSVIDDIFGGMLQSVVVCGSCNHASHCFDPFLDLSVPISGRNASMADCMSSFTEVERLGKSDGYRCEKCKCSVRATKQLLIYSLPKILIISLKRFSSSSGLGRFSSFSKNSSPVTLASKGINMAPFCNPNGVKGSKAILYDLIGCSNHSGGLGGGHYTAECKNFKDNKWYDCNDSHVAPTQEPSGSSSAAYVMFYRRRD